MSVQQRMTRGLSSLLQPRLTQRAQSELQQLQLSGSVTLTEERDERVCAFEKEDHKLATALIYRASMRGEQQLPSFAFVWHNFAPPRVRFFTWLLTQNSIHCKVNLSRKGIVHEATCDICTKEDEDADHIISGCEFARQFWLKIGWNPDDIHHVDTL